LYATSATAEELQEQLLAWEDELTQMEEVSVDLEAKQAKTEATRKEYLDKMEVHTAHAKHSLSLDKMLGEKKV
jgi:hypothetical protein